MSRATLVRPPPVDTSKSIIENNLELTELSDVQPDLFTNTRELWHPPHARGLYGGFVIAQCLLAACKTIPSPSSSNNQAVFLPHSMHCYFILAGNATIPILFHVERVRDGRSFITRTVQARQRGKCIFTTTISFMSETSGGENVIQHGADMPSDAGERLDKLLSDENNGKDSRDPPSDLEKEAEGEKSGGPFVSKRLGIANSISHTFHPSYNLFIYANFIHFQFYLPLLVQQKKKCSHSILDSPDASPEPHNRHVQSWLKCRGKIAGGISAHLAALAYMTDNTFIGVVSKVHGLERFGKQIDSKHAYLRQLAEEEIMEHGSQGGTGRLGKDGRESVNTPAKQPDRGVGMMVSLDHTIYFHRPREVEADDWLFSEMESPWAGQGRGMVSQRMWNREGRLVATCVQEGLVRLQQDEEKVGKSKL